MSGDPDGTRTRVLALRGLCPNRWTTGPRSHACYSVLPGPAPGLVRRKSKIQNPKSKMANGDPDGTRTRVAALKGPCPNRWTTGPQYLYRSRAGRAPHGVSGRPGASLYTKPIPKSSEGGGARTRDPQLKRLLLYQLSYAPTLNRSIISVAPRACKRAIRKMATPRLRVRGETRPGPALFVRRVGVYPPGRVPAAQSSAVVVAAAARLKCGRGKGVCASSGAGPWRRWPLSSTGG
jgi:hypothetical protein